MLGSVLITYVRLLRAWRFKGEAMIYFIQSCCPNGFIKIGRARDIPQRLGKLQNGTPYELKVLRVLAGGITEERFLHRDFADARERGEWYRPTEKVLRYIESTAVACLGPNPPPEPVTEEDHLRRANLAEARALIANAKVGRMPTKRGRKAAIGSLNQHRNNKAPGSTLKHRAIPRA